MINQRNRRPLIQKSSTSSRELYAVLEPRMMLTTTFYFDFGAGLPIAGLNTDVTAFRDIAGANSGTDLALDAGMNAGDDLNIARLAYDFDGNGTPGEVSDVNALAAAALPLIQRALEPYDIDAVIVSATSLADVGTTLAANAGDASGEFDAYNFVTTFTSTTLVTIANPTGSVGIFAGLFGLASRPDFNGAAGNFVDEVTQSYADNIFNSTPGTAGSAAFNANLAQRTAYTATHEGAHTMGLRHAINLPASGDVIRLGSNTRDNPFMITRFDLARADGPSSPVNNYDMFAADADIGLRDANTNGIPDLAFASGTGAHDLIDLDRNSATVIDVDVEAFSDQAMTASLGSEIYSIDLTTGTESDVLVDAGINNDEVRVDATIAAAMRLRGGAGIDGVGTENDLLTLQSGGLTGVYIPGVGSGTVNYAGGVSIQYSEFENVEANGIPIQVLPLTLSSNAINESGSLMLSGEFVNLDTMDTHEVTIHWGNGTSTQFQLAAGVRTFSRSHVYDDDNPTGTPFDPYDITVTITDMDDGTGQAMAQVQVNNVAPTITLIGLSSASIDESESMTVSGTFADPALGVVTETFSGAVLWSDGVITILTIDGSSGTFSTTRTFLDDDPMTGTSSDLFTVAITIDDDDLGSSGSEVSPTLTVNNVIPVIESFSSDATFEDKAMEGEPVNISALFTDIGILDTHSATVDWGDGNIEPVTVSPGVPGTGTVSGTHAYVYGGVYTITLTLTDDDTGIAVSDTIAVVTGVGLNNGVLYVIGSPTNDTVSINQTGRGSVKVHASFIPEEFRSYPVSGIDTIIAYLCEGNDKMTISSHVGLSAILHGGGGNDMLHAGGGNTVLLGDAGDDWLIGQGGRNILIGGTGRDRLVGGRGDDVLIGGSTDQDHDDLALSTAMMIWSDAIASYDDRALDVAGLLDVIDDGERDRLTGSSGRDLFFAGLGDILTDVRDDEWVI
ncbi:MAG: PKD domain-containing protein [Pirellulaceae bacterium]